MFAGNFAPSGWSFCNGQLLPITQNQALFAILGTTYGGNGINTFALPNLQARAPLGAGQGPGLSPYQQGQVGGQASVTLLPSQLPPHNHLPTCLAKTGTQINPNGASFAVPGASRGLKAYNQTVGAAVPLSPAAVAAVGGSQPHNNMAPYLGLTFIIAIVGIFPSRN